MYLRRGTYVLNKQTPSQQLWLSSPVRSVAALVFRVVVRRIGRRSGPARFGWSAEAQDWVNARGNARLGETIGAEVEDRAGVRLDLALGPAGEASPRPSSG